MMKKQEHARLMHTQRDWLKRDALRRDLQAGIVLPLALVLLVVISIIGVWAISSSTGTERMMAAQRNTTTAQQAAEYALRVCEDITIEKVESSGNKWATFHGKVHEVNKATPPKALDGENDDSARWRKKENWIASERVDVPDMGGVKHQPQCMIEAIDGGSYLITARGFGNDVVFNGNVTKSGAEVWLQSVITPEE